MGGFARNSRQLFSLLIAEATLVEASQDVLSETTAFQRSSASSCTWYGWETDEGGVSIDEKRQDSWFSGTYKWGPKE